MANDRKRTPKGRVSVYVADGRIKLRWQGQDSMNRSKRFSLTFGAVNEPNRIAAERLAKDIELDIASKHFDPTLRKYKPELERKPDPLTVDKLIDRYVNNHFTPDQSSSLERYRSLKNHLSLYFRTIEVDDISELRAKNFVKALIESGLQGDTVNCYVVLIRATWNWAVERGHCHSNPWDKIDKTKPAPKPPPKPFSEDEVRRILKAFEESYYYNFVRFLFGAGCRIGEAVELHWDALNDDCSDVWIGRA